MSHLTEGHLDGGLVGFDTGKRDIDPAAEWCRAQVKQKHLDPEMEMSVRSNSITPVSLGFRV